MPDWRFPPARTCGFIAQEYSIRIRDRAYNALLDELKLDEDHKEKLLARGFKEDEITCLGYRSTCALGLTNLTRSLIDKGISVEGVPGFYKTKSGEWSFVHTGRGILIPVRDCNGLIQGLQLRLDNTDKRKFRWISSRDRSFGCGALGWVHVAGKVQDKMLLTEGPIKADVIHALSGLSVIAVPGVNAISCLEKALLLLKEQGLREIKTAFDMDMLTNQHVQNGFYNLMSLLSDMDFKFGTYFWDEHYKGLDDYIWEYMLKRKR